MMRIAQVAPLYERVPPTTYGGTERVVSYLTEELVKLGHDVTLFASGDSRTTATLVPMRARSIRTDVACLDPLASHLLMLEEVARAARDFDVVHFHTGFLQFPVARRLACAHVTTLHGRLDLPDLPALFDEFLDMPLVSISNAQRRPLAHASWQRTVYHGIPPAAAAVQPEIAWLPGVRRAHLAGEAAGSRDRDRPSRRLAVEDCRESGQRRSRLLSRRDRTDAVDAWRRIHRRGGRVAEGRSAWRGAGVAVSHRLARAVWHGPHRGDGVRDADRCLGSRLRARDRRAREQRLHRQQHQGRGGSRGRERDAGSSRVPRRVRGEVHGRPDGTGLRLDL